MTAFWRAAPAGVTVLVKVQPKSRRPGLQGTAASADGMRLKIGVTEAAEDGRATQAACATLARALSLPQSAVQLMQGATTREKILAVTGDTATLIERLETL